MFNSSRKIIIGVVLGFLSIILLITAGKIWENIDAGEIVVIQDPIDGDLHVYTTPGTVGQYWGKATHYKKSSTFWFSSAKPGEDTSNDRSIPVKWNDGGHANISGSIRYDLPTDIPQMIKLHSIFGSQDAIEQQVIKTNIEKAIYLTGPLMTSKESYAERRNDLIFYIEDQASKGVYKTRQIEVKETDPITNTEKTTMKVEIQSDSSGVTKRQEVSPIITSGIKLYNISINGIKYDANVERQIATQQQAIMQVQTAIAKSKEAEQRALTVEKEGEADAAQAKWEQEVIKAKLVTEAQAANAVAQLSVKTAELNKQKDILEGEGVAAKKRLSMQANGALEQKLAAYTEVQKYWADAFSKFQGNLVPLYQSGGGTSNAVNWMEIMGMKAAKDLNLDMSNKNN